MAITPLPDPPLRSDAPDVFVTKADTFLSALPGFVVETNDLAIQLNGMVVDADAVASAADAALQGSAYIATSSSSLAIGTGAKAFALNEAGKAFAANDVVAAVRRSDASAWMFGTVSSVVGQTVNVNVTKVGGSGGPFTDWLFMAVSLLSRFVSDLTVTQKVIFSGTLTPPSISADQNDYNPTGLSSAFTIRAVSTSARVITGIVAQENGRLLKFHNVGNFTITLAHANAGSAAANRFNLGQDVEVRAGQAILLQYDASGGFWYKADTTPPARASDVRTGSATSSFLTPGDLYSALAEVALTDGATITPDFGAGLNFGVTLGGNRTMANPTNAKVGQSGVIRITQDATGSRTLAFGTAWKRDGGAPVLSTAAGSVDYLAYQVVSASVILYGFARAPSN